MPRVHHRLGRTGAGLFYVITIQFIDDQMLNIREVCLFVIDGFAYQFVAVFKQQAVTTAVWQQ